MLNVPYCCIGKCQQTRMRVVTGTPGTSQRPCQPWSPLMAAGGLLRLLRCALDQQLLGLHPAQPRAGLQMGRCSPPASAVASSGPRLPPAHTQSTQISSDPCTGCSVPALLSQLQDSQSISACSNGNN